MIPFGAVFLPLLVAYAATLWWCVERWNAPTQYFTHCWLVPVVAGVVSWRRRRQWRDAPRAFAPRGAWLLGPGLSLHCGGALLMVDSWSAASLVLTVPGAAWLALGRARLAGLWPVLWLVVFVVPAPIYVEGRAAFALKELAVAGGVALANGLGADIVRQGDRLLPQGIAGSLWVADACSGLRSLLAMLTLAYCLAFFTGPPRLARRVALLVLAPFLAIGANTLRIGLLCGFARLWGVPFAEGAGHDLANIGEWAALLAVLLAVDAVLSRGGSGGSAAGAALVSGRLDLRLPRAVPLRVSLLLWGVCGPLLWLSLYRPVGLAAQRADQLPGAIAGYTQLPRSAQEETRFQSSLPRWRELLGTGDFVWRRYRDAAGMRINLVALFHDTNWKSVHPPRICIEGSGMDIEVDDLVAGPGLGDGVRASRIVAKSRGDGGRYVTLSLFGTSDWAAGDYWDFTWHHLPRALLRANLSGFLLRVESPVQRGEQVAAAEARCASFLQALLPLAREQLR